MKVAKDLAREFALAQKNGAPQLVHFLKKFKARLNEIQEGELLLVPGSVGVKSVLFIVEREQGDLYRFCVVNTDPCCGGLEYHVSRTNDTAPKIKYQKVVVIKSITREKILDDAFWGMLFKLAVYKSDHNTFDKLYDLLLPFLTDKPYEQLLAESEEDEYTDFHSPQRSQTNSVRACLETGRYVLRRRGLSLLDCKSFYFLLRWQLVLFAKHDLTFVKAIGDSDRRVIHMACAQLSHAAVKAAGRSGVDAGAGRSAGRSAGGEGEKILSNRHLKAVYTLVEDLRERVYAAPCYDAVLTQY